MTDKFLKAIKPSLRRWLLLFEELECFEAIKGQITLFFKFHRKKKRI